MIIYQLIYYAFKSLTYYTGFPAHNYPEGINLPGGTTLSSPISHPLSNCAPSNTNDLEPILTWSSIIALFTTQQSPIYTF